MQYFGEDLIGELVDGYGCQADWAEKAIDLWVNDIRKGEYVETKILSEADPEEEIDMSFDGDVELDAEHIYSTSKYWNEDNA